MSVLLDRLDSRLATLIRVAGLALIAWSVLSSGHHPAGSGRGLAVSVLLALAILSWLRWTSRPNRERGLTPDLYVLAGAGGALVGASPDSAASAFVFVAVVAAALRAELRDAGRIAVVGALGVAVSVLVYNGSGLGLVAYTLGFAASLLAGSNSRQSIVRAEQAELLLAQTQRSHEEQLRAARLEESARIARDIHDVLAHTLAGLAIQLEATSALLERGADRDAVLQRIRRAHELAREGLHEARRAVGALRGESVRVAETLDALVADHRESAGAPVELTIAGDPELLAGPTGEAIVRVAQEALTNVRKHAPGAEVSIVLRAGEAPGDQVVLIIEDRFNGASPAPPPGSLAATGGGFGLRGMHERAERLGGELRAGAAEDGWRVELRLPPPVPSLGAGTEPR